MNIITKISFYRRVSAAKGVARRDIEIRKGDEMETQNRKEEIQ